jgi:hypothetical protein
MREARNEPYYSPPLAIGTSWRHDQRVDYRAARDLIVRRRPEGQLDLAYVHAGDGAARCAFGADVGSIPSIEHPPGRLDPRVSFRQACVN